MNGIEIRFVDPDPEVFGNCLLRKDGDQLRQRLTECRSALLYNLSQSIPPPLIISSASSATDRP